MKYFLISAAVLLLWLATGHAQNPLKPTATTVTLATWNLENFGASKDEAEIKFIAQQLQYFDVVAVQEVSVTPAGAQAVARLKDALNRTGSKWQSELSQPTTSDGGGSERYAYFWKPSRVTKVTDGWLDQHYEKEIDREPYCISFRTGSGREFTMVQFHAVPKKKQPEHEIKYLKYLPSAYPGKKLVFCGDFNCPQSNSVFNPLKTAGYLPVLQNQRTTLRMECKDDGCLANEYDNVLCQPTAFRTLQAGVVPFHERFADMRAARAISDHLPVWAQLELK